MPEHVWEIIDICAQIEHTVADMYHLFSQLHAADPELAEIWKKTAAEEENHERQFLLAARLTKGSASRTKARISADSARTMLQRISGLHDRVKAVQPSPAAALKLALEIEEKLAEFHTLTAVSFDDDNLVKLFGAMMANDNDHVGGLRKQLERLMKQGKG